MGSVMERAIIWARAQADDLRDAEGLCETARKLKAMSDNAGASIFSSRAKTHISYVEENGQKLKELIQKLENADNAPDSFQAIHLKILEAEQNAQIARLKCCLNEIAA